MQCPNGEMKNKSTSALWITKPASRCCAISPMRDRVALDVAKCRVRLVSQQTFLVVALQTELPDHDYKGLHNA